MTVALVLSGGGARAAYQVGVLKAVDEILKQPAISPFKIICGASAGAINASLLACESDNFTGSVKLLNNLWAQLNSNNVHELGLGAVLTSVFNLLKSVAREDSPAVPWSLLDNTPLKQLLKRVIRFERLQERVENGDLQAISITSLAYSTGESVAFFSSRQDKSWRRHRRVGVKVDLNLNHLMASAAIPAIYPAVRIHREFFGDGAVRQTAPLSPALHLGATKLFVIGVSHNTVALPERQTTNHAPSIATMTSHFLNGSFIDALEEDTERLSRLNKLLGMISEDKRAQANLVNVDMMSIVPSRPFNTIALGHISELSWTMRLLFRLLGATKTSGSSLASYLLFEAGFIRELINCGYRDSMEQRDAIEAFLATPEST